MGKLWPCEDWQGRKLITKSGKLCATFCQCFVFASCGVGGGIWIVQNCERKFEKLIMRFSFFFFLLC